MRIEGQASGGNYRVWVDGVRLGHKASCKVSNHSPSGFAWGYGGSGPAQLALAILLLRTDDESAVLLHQDFKAEFIAALNKDEDFEIDVNVEQYVIDQGYKAMVRSVGMNEKFDREKSIAEGECFYPEKCQKAMAPHCDCSCGGVNHGIQMRMFT